MIEFDNLTYLHGKPQGTGLLNRGDGKVQISPVAT